ncbi:hypothetical protein J5N97_018035 [Dioscorea zingiberensis]|uniref:CTLH domain-containing protein n=1 Tax=Dioscorea zingiberensis TaxID=325984 RepID=A0A9D5CMN3_9LILI|nr:hypothetical protein J5N97_018035 [Dioscorea zingiberensis]
MGRGSKRPRRLPKSAKKTSTIDDEIDASEFARTQKFLKQKFGGYDDEIYDDDDDEEDYEEQRKAAWGGRKSWYYGADNVDYELQSSDEDILLEEEAEAVRMQKEKAKFLTLEDFGLEEDDEVGSDSDSKEKKQEMKQIESNLRTQVDKNFIKKVATKSTDKLVNQSEVTNVPTKTHESPVKVSTHSAIDGSLKKKRNKHANQKDQNDRVGLQSMEMLKVRADLEAKLKQEGLYNNVMNSKNGSNQKNSSKPINKHLETRDDFDDEVQLEQMVENTTSLSKLIPNNGNKPKVKISTHSAIDGSSEEKHNKYSKLSMEMLKVFSGDDDVPMRDSIGERRRKHELRVLARARTVSMDDEKKAMDIDDETTDPEDDFYKEVKRQRMEKLKAKAALYSRTPRIPVAPPTLGTEQDGRPVRRPITDEMWKNRGLTRYRKKLTKNPRKKYKTKHQKAVMRRKGQVPDIRRPYGPYGGEATGINPYISRSVRSGTFIDESHRRLTIGHGVRHRTVMSHFSIALRILDLFQGMATSKKVITREEWERKLRDVKIRKQDMNKLVMNFLVTEGYVEAADKFRIESGTEPDIDLATITDRMAVKKAVQSGDVVDAIEKVNDLNPEILDTNPQLYFHLQQQRLIELIRVGKVEEALEFAQEELAPRGEENQCFLDELERTVALLAFEDVKNCPYGELLDLSQRLKTASEVNAAILTSQSHEKEPKLPSLLKMLIWAQNQLDEKAVYPHITDLVKATIEDPPN